MITLIQILLMKPYNVINNCFSDNDINPDSSPDSTKRKRLPSVPPIPVTNSEFIETDYTLRTKIIAEKPTSSYANLINTPLTVQRLPLSPKPVAPAITSTITLGPIHIRDPSDIDPPSFPLAPAPHKKNIS